MGRGKARRRDYPARRAFKSKLALTIQRTSRDTEWFDFAQADVRPLENVSFVMKGGVVYKDTLTGKSK